LPNFLKSIFFAMSHRMFHLGMAAGVGFSGRIGMEMYPRVDAECFAFSQQKLFTISELYRTY
jgi:hypothetical protein